MVDVTGLGRPVAVREATRHVAHPDELIECGRRPVLRLSGGRWPAQVPDLRPAADQLGQQRRRHHTAAGDDRCTRPGRNGFGVGQHVDDHTGRPGIGRRTVRTAALTGQRLHTGCQRAERIGAALGDGAWIVLAYLVRHLSQLALQHRGIGGQQTPPQRRGARLGILTADRDVPTARARLRTPQRTRVMTIDPHVDRLLQLVLGQPVPAAGVFGDRGVDEGQGRTVLNEVGPPGDRRRNACRQRAFQEQCRDLGQPVPQRQAEMHLPGSPTMTDPQRGRDLSGRGVPFVARPMRMFVIPATPGRQFRNRGQAQRRRGGSSDRSRLDRLDQRRVRDVPELIIEHVFDYAIPL